MVHVCFALHDATGCYSKFTGTAMLSLFENTREDVTVHILHDNTLTTDNRDKFSCVAGRYNQRVRFYNVERLCADKIAEYVKIIPSIKQARVGIGALFRFVIPRLFLPKIDKVIYLDSDVIVNLDIDELWQIEMGDKPIGVVPDIDNGVLEAHKFSIAVREGFVDNENYFNSGVLLMNLNVLQNEEDVILDGLKFRSKCPPDYQLFDQEILNYCFAARTLKLPVKFNRMIKNMRANGEELGGENIYHYAGGMFGLRLDISDPFNRLWLEYFAKTPWFDIQLIQRLYDRAWQREVSLKKFTLELVSTLAGKTRVFVVGQRDLDDLNKIFSVKDTDEIIIAEEGTLSKEVLDAMNASRGKKVFFIMVRKFPFNALTKAGFVYKKDFFNAYSFRPNESGTLMDSYAVIQAM